jgi:hypothetical protein
MTMTRLFRYFAGVAGALLLISPAELPAQAAPPATSAESDLPQAFVRRSTKKGGGKFFTAADFAKISATATPQLLARLSGGDLRDVGGGDIALVNRRGIRQTFSAGVENELCRIGIVVNDNRVPDNFDLKSISLTEILAVEHYSGPATIPPELNGTAGDAGRCGLLVVWVKGR